MKSQVKNREPVLAAGGIVLRADAGPCVAVVRLRKNNAWVLPKGKLKPGEDPLDAARREATEETGHDVAVHEYLGEIPSEPGRRKAIRFWRMQAAAEPAHELMHDVKSVKWLPLDKAVANFGIARALRSQGDLANSRRHLLDALETAPHYRPAQDLLLEMVGDRSQ